jgi:hypothetical protein
VQFLTILFSSRILWLPFINTCRAHNRLQMRNQRKRKTKMEGRREKRRRSLRFQMGLNLWLCDLRDKFYHSPSLRRICSYQILKDSNAHIWNVEYALLVNKSNCGYFFSFLFYRDAINLNSVIFPFPFSVKKIFKKENKNKN